MISWIVASHRPELLATNLLSTLEIDNGDDLVVIENAPSITMAYAEGQERATQPIRCYIHSDVQILDTSELRSQLIETTPGVGIVGVIGSRSMVLPWWNGDLLGSVQDGRLGTLDFGLGGPCDVLDGLLLASRRTLTWDTDWPGWHGYDYDICQQMLYVGSVNFCLDNGKDLIRHNSDSPFALDSIEGWHDAPLRFIAKWGTVT